jgi:two-component system, OmpR family, response regulator MprA
MRILVVDDEAAVRESLERSLRFEGYEVVVAGDGAEALEQVGRQRPDAVVLDVLMPRVDGLEACRRLRGRGDNLPVLLLTARDGVVDRVNGLDVGADDYLVKPFALEELRALLRRAGGTGASGVLACRPAAGGGHPRGASGDRAIALTRTEFNLRRGVECRRPVAARPAAAARPRGGRIGRRHLRAGGDAAGRLPHRRTRRGGHAVRPPRRHLITTWCAIEVGVCSPGGFG